MRRLLIAVGAVALAGCATQPAAVAYDPPGFWSGLLHGLLIFFALVGSVFADYRIYAFPNSGGWYDFGYFLGVTLWWLVVLVNSS